MTAALHVNLGDTLRIEGRLYRVDLNIAGQVDLIDIAKFDALVASYTDRTNRENAELQAPREPLRVVRND